MSPYPLSLCEDGTKVRLQVWDIEGQAVGSKMIKSYIYNAHVRACMHEYYYNYQHVLTSMPLPGGGLCL